MDKDKKKTKKQISFRLKEDTIDRLKEIPKYHSKIDTIINIGLDIYDKVEEEKTENVLESFLTDEDIEVATDITDKFKELKNELTDLLEDITIRKIVKEEKNK